MRKGLVKHLIKWAIGLSVSDGQQGFPPPGNIFMLVASSGGRILTALPVSMGVGFRMAQTKGRLRERISL